MWKMGQNKTETIFGIFIKSEKMQEWITKMDSKIDSKNLRYIKLVVKY